MSTAPINVIQCPKCKKKFELTEALAGPLLEAEREAAQKRVDDLNAKTDEEVQKARRAALSEGAAAERKKFAEDMDASTKAASDAQESLQASIRREADLHARLGAAQEAQAEAVRKSRELDEARRELALTVQTQVNAGLAIVRDKARREADEANASRLGEKEKAMSELREKIAELERKAAHGDNRIQGEVQELALEKQLREAFPRDTVEPVAKGVAGGDSILRVLTLSGGPIGAILFESKDTQAWDQKWLAKLRADQRAANADTAVLVTRTMPKGVSLFEQIEGVWVTSLAAAMALTTVLRAGLLAAYGARIVTEGQETKAAMIYAYVTQGGYKHRIQAFVDSIACLKTALDKERSALERQWAIRAATHDKLVAAVFGMHGDVAGIAGQSVEEIESASLAALGEVPRG